MVNIIKELVGPDVEVVREYDSMQAAVERVKNEKFHAVLTGWKIRKDRGVVDYGSDELVGPDVVAAAKKRDIPSAVISSHPDALSFEGATVINKTTMELTDLASFLKAMLDA